MTARRHAPSTLEDPSRMRVPFDFHWTLPRLLLVDVVVGGVAAGVTLSIELTDAAWIPLAIAIGVVWGGLAGLVAWVVALPVLRGLVSLRSPFVRDLLSSLVGWSAASFLFDLLVLGLAPTDVEVARTLVVGAGGALVCATAVWSLRRLKDQRQDQLNT